MNSIQTPSLPGGKKRYCFPFLLCSLAFTSVALGGVSLIRFEWLPNFHPYSNANSASSAALEAELIVYPNGLAPENDFYITATTPHSVDGGEILIRYYGGATYFGLEEGPAIHTPLDDKSMEDYIGTNVFNSQTYSVLRYRLSNRRTVGSGAALVCNNYRAAIATASNGTSLPQSTIYVTTYPGFSPHVFPTSGGIQIVTSTGASSITYTGTTTQSGATTSFTGCTGGTGTLATGDVVAQLSGNTTTATHFQNTIYLFNYANDSWDEWYDREFDHTVLLHDCTACGGVCGTWGVMFESNLIYPAYTQCAEGVLPPIGVLDVLVSVNDGSWVQGNEENSSFASTLDVCNPLNPLYTLINYDKNYSWIIGTP
jgi:hypothetical protein